jgi:hypothetical protein
MSTLVAQIRELVLEREAEARARGLSEETHKALSAHFAAAKARIKIADAQGTSASNGIALDLYREAVTQLCTCLALVRGQGPLGAEDVEKHLESDVERVAFVLPRTADAEGRQVRDAEVQAVRTVALRLYGQVDARSVRAIQGTRIGRLLALAIVILWMLAPLVGKIARGRNLARGAVVTMSAQFPGTPNPNALTNGEIESAFGAHTARQAEPWIRVDLGSPLALTQVRVFPRGDGFLQEGIPLVFEVSTDGQSYTTVATRSTEFSQSDPWIVRESMRVRYIRLRMPGSGYVALSELEAY